ncbi:MAG: cupredoxin domain-containing protein [Gammaproteobacteria bacterium]|nr:cupredoxin domain-containing protein [Gammaproteobacteria bacterium]
MLFVNLAGFALILLIAWWFWFYQPKRTELDSHGLVITVDNGVYTPAHLTLAANLPATVYFLRKDASPCAEIVMFPELEISESLPLNKPVAIQLPALQPGDYPFHCQMQMYRGVLAVEN